MSAHVFTAQIVILRRKIENRGHNHHMRAFLPPDCLGVIVSHADEPTLRSLRLVSVGLCAAAGDAAKTRAGDVFVTQYDNNKFLLSFAKCIIPVTNNWKIRVYGDIAVTLCRLQQFDRGIVREIVARRPQHACIYVPKLNLYISYNGAPTG